MTPERLQLLDFIRDRIERTGVAPSYREMMHRLGYHSSSGVHDMVKQLVADGLLIRARYVVRGLRLPGPDPRAISTAALRAELARRKAA